MANKTLKKKSSEDSLEQKQKPLNDEKPKVQKGLDLCSLALQETCDGIVMGDINGKITYVNDAVMQMLGRSDKNDFIGKNVLEFVAEHDRARAQQKSIDSMKTGEGYIGQFTTLQGNGSEMEVELTATPIKDKMGNQIGFIDIVRNIAERKKIERAVTKQAALIDLSSNAIIVKNLDEEITFWNKGAEKLYGYSKEEAIGTKINVLLKANYFDSLEKICEKLRQGEHWIGELTHFAKNGNAVLVRSDWLATLDEGGNIVEILESNLDITESKKVQEQFVSANEKFLVIGKLTRHDVRNALTLVRGNLYLLKKKFGSDPETVEYFTRIESAVGMADKLFEFSRLYEKIGTEKQVNVNVKRCFDEAAALFPELHVRVFNECDGLVLVADSLLGSFSIT